MSKLDTFTVFMVSLCLVALSYLVYKTIKLRELKKEIPTSVVTPENDAEETTTASTIKFDDEGKVIKPAAADEADLDDDQVNVNNGTLVEEEEAAPAEEDAEKPKEKIASKPVEEKVPDNFETTGSSSSGNYLVLAGSFKQKANAEAQVKRLKKMGFDEAQVTSFNGGSLAVALVGRFDSSAAANKLAKQVEAKGIDAFVKRKN